jgi:hypothetical protein
VWQVQARYFVQSRLLEERCIPALKLSVPHMKERVEMSVYLVDNGMGGMKRQKQRRVLNGSPGGSLA